MGLRDRLDEWLNPAGRRLRDRQGNHTALLHHPTGEMRIRTPDWVVLAGWMRVLSMSFLGWFPGMVVNLHPALPGELPGVNSIERAWHEAQAGQRDHTGVMVHLVPDEGVDDGLSGTGAAVSWSTGFAPDKG